MERSRPSVARMCDLLGVSRSGYYDWVERQAAGPGPRAQRLSELAGKVAAAHEESDSVYGAPRITAELRAAGEVVSVKTVAKVMRHNGIHGISPRPWHPVTTITDPSPHAIPDFVGRRFDTGELNTVWTSDITYLATGEGWVYLCAVRDGCSRRVLGYAFSDSLHTDIVEDALRRAVTFRDGDTVGVILHADSKTVACLGAPGFRDSHADRPWGLPWCRRCSRSILTRTPIDPGKVSFPGHVGCSGAPLARPAVSPEPCD